MRGSMLWTLAMFIAAAFGTGAAEAAPAGKILVAYFSYSGNTRAVAQRIHNAVGGDLYEIRAADAYPQGYNDCTDRAKKEQTANARPALAGTLANADSYDVIFLGYPNWWGTLPMPVFTFLETYGFSGKTIAPFCTHGGGGLGRGPADIARLSPKAAVAQGLSLNGSGAANASPEVAAWLRKLGYQG